MKTVDFKEKCIMIIVIGSCFEFTYFFDFYENEINTIYDKSNTVIKEIDESSEKQITKKLTTIM